VCLWTCSKANTVFLHKAEPSVDWIPADIASKNPHAPELNILVVGMPNVGKSTLLNTLRHYGIDGREYSVVDASSAD
jgi:mitochondrial GTPase 1